MSNAVTSTGILVKRGTIVPPATVVLTSAAVSSPITALSTLLTTAAPHGLTKGDEVTVAGSSGSTGGPLNGVHTVLSVPSPTTALVALVAPLTVAGTGGTTQQTYAVVAEITDVDPGGKSRNKIPTSTHNDGSESNVLGLLRQSDPTLKINYVGTEASHVAINADIDNNVKNNWMIKYPSGVSRSGQAYVQMFKYDPAPVDGKQGASLALTWAGPVTEVAA